MPRRKSSLMEMSALRCWPGVNHKAGRLLFLFIFAGLSFGQQLDVRPNNYYSPDTERELGERFVKHLLADVAAAPEPRLDRLGKQLTPHEAPFELRFYVFDGGKPSPDEAPAAAAPADWRRLQIDEAIAVAGGTVFVPRGLLSRNDTQLTAILAHAIGHIELRHATIGLTLGELAQVEVQAASRSRPEEAPQLVSAVATKRFAFDRTCELAADEYAARLLHDAGLDPGSLLEYLRTLPAAENKPLAPYPSPAERIQAAQAAIQNLKH